jgi:hypothetical protein
MKTRIEELRQKIKEATGQNPTFGTAPGCPPEVEEAFLERVLVFETSPSRILVDVLADLGITLPPPDELKDKQLTAKLWEVINTLLLQRIVISNSDHLSDRELYELLWKETLREEFVICPPELGYTIHLDMTETCEEDSGMPTYLKYYASHKDRQMYAEANPGRALPERVEPPPRRDHLIPDCPPIRNKKQVH